MAGSLIGSGSCAGAGGLTVSTGVELDVLGSTEDKGFNNLQLVELRTPPNEDNDGHPEGKSLMIYI